MVVPSSRLRNCAFVDFKDERTALQAQWQLYGYPSWSLPSGSHIVLKDVSILSVVDHFIFLLSWLMPLWQHRGEPQCGLVRLRFLGKVLSVERAIKPTEHNAHVGGESESNTPKSLTKDTTDTRDTREGHKVESQYAAEPIAEKLGVDYPFPPHLEYVSFFLPYWL